MDFFLLFFPRKNAQKNPPRNPPQNSPGTLFGKTPLGFLQKPFLDSNVGILTGFASPCLQQRRLWSRNPDSPQHLSGYCWDQSSLDGQNRAIIIAESLAKERERAQNADFRRKPQIFADSPPSPGNSSSWRAQETADFRRKAKTFAEELGPSESYRFDSNRQRSLVVLSPSKIVRRGRGPRLEARHPLRAFRGFVPISGTPSLFFKKTQRN